MTAQVSTISIFIPVLIVKGLDLPVDPAARNRNGTGMAEDQMFDDLEVMLGGPT